MGHGEKEKSVTFVSSYSDFAGAGDVIQRLGIRLRALIVPKAHIAGYFDLPEKLRTACWLMVDRVHWLLEQRYSPEEWRIEVAVGCTVAHAHVELSAFRPGEAA